MIDWVGWKTEKEIQIGVLEDILRVFEDCKIDDAAKAIVEGKLNAIKDLLKWSQQ